MAYNSFYPAYQPNYQFQPQITPQAQNGTQGGIVWVQGIEGAKAYPVGAGGNAILMDSEESLFYIKSTDQSGMPMPLRVFSYTEKKEDEQPSIYVTKDELEARLKEITTPKKSTKKKGDEDE